ncbi:hypothetical protein LSH36_813g00003, partial [Paralvinella palmiformis]
TDGAPPLFTTHACLCVEPVQRTLNVVFVPEFGPMWVFVPGDMSGSDIEAMTEVISGNHIVGLELVELSFQRCCVHQGQTRRDRLRKSVITSQK